MEWIEITGKSIEEAKEEAANRLGVAIREIEVEVLEEPKPGLFGRLKGEARIRARVKPKRAYSPRRTSNKGTDKRTAQNRQTTRTRRATTSRQRTSEIASSNLRRRRQAHSVKKITPWTEVSQDEISNIKEVSTKFLEGLLDVFDLKGQVKFLEPENESLPIEVEGENLGLLVGPSGVTLSAVQELVRTVAKYHAKSPIGRVDLDIANYRQRRIKALQEFAIKLAQEVKEAGRAKALEPMTPADRKVVHTTLAEIEGVTTYSKGDDPYRYVVIAPTAPATTRG
jgi:spoIIIJ-associated protein